jgi:hypothetical protein
MNARASAGMFFNKLGRGPYGDFGRAAQRVQVSAFPGAYSKWQGKADGMVRAVGFDQGGEARGKGLMVKDIIAPERVLPPVETQSYNTLTELMGKGGVQLSYDDRGSQTPTQVVVHQHLPDGASGRRYAQELVHEMRRNDFRGVH